MLGKRSRRDKGNRGDARARAREDHRTVRGKLWPLVRSVHTYRRADRGGLRSDRKGAGIGD